MILDDLETMSMDDEDFTESNIEDMESDPEAETSTTTDYWFGKMYLKCTIAEEVLREPSDTMSLESADRYPYDEVLTSLQAQGIARPDYIVASRRTATTQTEASRMALFTLIGTIVRTGRRGERSALLACLRRNRRAGSSSDPHEHLHTSTANGRAEPQPQEGMGPSRPAGPGEQRPTPPNEQDGPLEEMAKYTMALKEHGDRIDAQPSYKTITISQYPSRFMSVVSFGGSEENGESRTKRDAKHIASKKMCERLAIRFA
ncbi:hypothetical protein D6C78_10921 [Aureobasidium pullulans]|uniref:DRBM domain-containing protein n=1 Tax=Aureobasidium pullulans TaxID=5580 RepID=A0A4V4LCQ8_AURPU|nr:hypothetical protein D6C78_10921 [Aureobasidium pullulans]